MFRSLRARLPHIGRLPRLLLAGTCLLMAAASALGSGHHHRPSLEGARTVVAARNLAAGHQLVRSDLRVARLPASVRPRGARADPAALVGRRLAGAIQAREVLTAPRLVSADLAAGLRGLVAAAVPLDDPRAGDLIRPGNRVDLLEAPRTPDVLGTAAMTAPHVTTVAAGVAVLAVLPAREDAGAELIVAIDRATVVRITRDRSGQVFTAVAVPP